ncbi:MAG: methyltransferase domain-containing protein [Candidatus Riflebacteria bacterium]|nr:methyltransferase domain-containing protein [Candidatus Riflebacteria bacterium]
MIVYALMKYIEKIPVRYDRMMNLLTLGCHARAHEMMRSEIEPGMSVLDIGCGTGRFALAAAAKGARVLGVDSSPEMLRVFRENLLARPDLQARVEILECGAGSIGHLLGERRFDRITASLMLGELPDLVRARTIASAATLLAPGGKVVVCDEFWPKSRWMSALYHLLFWIFFVPNFILTRTLIQPVRGFERDVDLAGLSVVARRELLLGAMAVVCLVRSGE